MCLGMVAVIQHAYLSHARNRESETHSNLAWHTASYMSEWTKMVATTLYKVTTRLMLSHFAGLEQHLGPTRLSFGDSGTNPSHIKGLGGPGSPGQGEEERAAHDSVRSYCKGQWRPQRSYCQVCYWIKDLPILVTLLPQYLLISVHTKWKLRYVSSVPAQQVFAIVATLSTSIATMRGMQHSCRLTKATPCILALLHHSSVTCS